MVTLTYDGTKIKYNASEKKFTTIDKYVRFDTSYKIVNPKTSGSKEFNFTHSTGSEFDPNTKWIYKSDDGIIFEVSQDAELTKLRAKQYLEAKTRY